MTYSKLVESHTNTKAATDFEKENNVFSLFGGCILGLKFSAEHYIAVTAGVALLSVEDIFCS